MLLTDVCDGFNNQIDIVLKYGLYQKIVCVEDGWFNQPALARVSLIRLWGWVRLHTWQSRLPGSNSLHHTF